MTEERRQHPRIPVRTIVKMQFATIGEFLQSYAQNISEGGMQLAVAQELQEGDRVGLEFKLKSDYPLIQGTAVVRWCRSSGNHFIVGVAFEELDERSRNTISEALSINEKGRATEVVDDAETIDVVEDLLSPPDEIEEVVPEAGGFSTEIDGDLIDELSPPDDVALEPIEAIDADEVSIEEVSMDVPSATPESTGVPDLDSLELPEPEQADDEYEIEEVDLPAPPAVNEDVADLFEDTEVAPEQLDFGTGFDATNTMAGAESVADAAAVADGGGNGRKRLLAVVVVILAVGGVGFWWLSRPVVSQPQVAQQPPLPDVSPAPAPPGVPTAAPATGINEGEATEAGVQVTTGASAASEAAPVAAPSPPEPEPVPEPEPEPAAEPEPEPHSADEPARRVDALLRGSGSDWLVIETDGAIEGHYRYFGLSKPPRAVVDLIGLQRAPGVRVPSFDNHPNVRRVRIGVHPDKIRLVFDLRQDSGFTVVAEGHRLIVRAR